MNWFLIVLKKYADFSGRAQRAEYWYFVLFYVLIIIALSIIDSVAGLYDETLGLGVSGGLFALATLIPTLAVTVRRLHDTSRSGWWILLNLVPLIGGIVVLIFTCLDSTPGSNQYGPNPKIARLKVELAFGKRVA
jgi:uncharacterized membrane protein YhaH (DUF805 family)